MRLVTIRHDIERTARGDVHQRRYRQSDQHRDISAAERLGHGTLPRLRAEERNHRDEPDAIGPQAPPAPASVHAARIENLTHRVMAFAYEVEVDQVDRGPGREKIQENDQELAEFRDEVLRRCQGKAGPGPDRYETGPT